MIAAVMLRHYKNYENVNFLPISDNVDCKYTVYVGNNGVGKSGILESLDVVLNNREWNITSGAKKSEAYICPVFLIKKDSVSNHLDEYAFISNYYWNIDDSTNPSARNTAAVMAFLDYKNRIKEKYETDYYLILIGIQINDRHSYFSSTFDTDFMNKFMNNFNMEEEAARNILDEIRDEIFSRYNYLYIPVEQSLNELLKLENNEMQMLFLPMDENGRKYFYYTVRERFNSTTLTEETATEKAAQFIFLNKTCFNGLYRVNRKGQFNVPMGAYKNPTICDDENLRNIHEALQNVTIVCGDYSLSKSFIDKDTFVYLDPPYRPISETSAFTAYNSDTFDDEEQIRLSKFIDEINLSGAKIVLSNSDPKNVNEEDNFFDDLYKNYKINRVEATRAINSKGDKRGKINELLICN